MKKVTINYGIVVSAIVLLIIVFSSSTPARKTPSTVLIDTMQAERDMYMKQVLSSIKGHELSETDSVFTNIKTFKGVKGFSAQHFLLMMNIGWGKGLGVSCTYCHNPNDWSSDEKPQKDIARQMYHLRKTVNDELKKMENLSTKTVFINCVTCHHGKTIPEMN